MTSTLRVARLVLLPVMVITSGVVWLRAMPPARIARPRFGIVAFDLDGPVPAKLSALGVGLIRGSCGWDTLEPAPGVFNWTCADNVIVGAQAMALRSYMTVTCTPGWANGGAGCGVAPGDMNDWYRFVASFVSRYTLYNTVLGVWNEPNLSLEDTPDGANYALLFLNASNARNAVNPRFALGGPETSHHAVASGYYAGTMDTLKRWGAFDPQDVVAAHWYPDGPDLGAYMDGINASAGGHEVWLTETGDATSDAAAQAGFFDTVLTTFTAGDRPWWTHLVFYRLWDGLACCTEAILSADYTSKPAFDTYQRWLASPDQ